MFHRGVTLACFIMCVTAPLRASVNPADPPVLRVPVSARATALGNALYCDGEEGLRYNPAFLGDVNAAILQGTYGVFFEKTRFAHASFVAPTGSIGMAGGYTGIFSSFDNFIDADSPVQGAVDVSQSLVSIAAGSRVSDSHLLLGTGVRALVDSIAGDTSVSWIIDAGVGYLFSSRFKAGLVAHNALSMPGKGTDDAVGVAGIFSAVWQLPWMFAGQAAEDTNTLSAAVRRENGGDINAGFGWESVFARILAFRIGLDRDAPSAGIGFKFRSVSFDIATSWRQEAFLNFATLSLYFSRSQSGKVAHSAGGKVSKPARAIRDPAEEGWQLLQNNDPAGAEAVFRQVLKNNPKNFSAVQGLQSIQGRHDQTDHKIDVAPALDQGNAAFERKDYAKAVELFAAVSNDVRAEDGIRKSIEASARVLSGALAAKLNSPAVSAQVTRAEAAAMTRSGSFGSFDAAGQYLARKSAGKSLAAWQKVALDNNPVAQRFNPAFMTLVSQECAAATERATRLASKGQYAAAVAELDLVTAFPGLPEGDKHRVQGMSASYSYVGSAMGKNNYDKAVLAMRQGQNAQAILLFDRAVQCGYQTDEARRHMADLKAMPAASSPEGLSPGNVGENLARAREFFRQNKLPECRSYLIRVLYVEPRNTEARKMMDEIENN